MYVIRVIVRAAAVSIYFISRVLSAWWIEELFTL